MEASGVSRWGKVIRVCDNKFEENSLHHPNEFLHEKGTVIDSSGLILLKGATLALRTSSFSRMSHTVDTEYAALATASNYRGTCWKGCK